MNNTEHKQLALAAVMFFAPMVQWLMQEQKELDEQQKIFVTSYIKYGYRIIIAWIITIVSVIWYYFFPSTILYRLHTIAIITTISWLIIWSIGVISDNVIIKNDATKYNRIKGETYDIVWFFMPIYNIYRRYKEHNFIEPNARIKESIILWTIWSIITLITQNKILAVIVLILICIRIVTIAWWIDIRSDKIQKYIKIFNVNPEEIWAYPMASIDFIWQKIQKNIIQQSRNDIFRTYKKDYSYIVERNGIKQQYIIWIITLLIISIIYPHAKNRTWWVPVWLMLGRYIVMYYKWKHLPPLPIARELYILMGKVYKKMQKK
jgi:hypothetical protein